jgi:hypothetical protein
MEIRLQLTGHRLPEPQPWSSSFHLLVRLLKYLPIVRFVSLLPSVHILSTLFSSFTAFADVHLISTTSSQLSWNR